MLHMDANKIDSIATKVGGALKNLRINMNLAPVLDPPKDDRGKNGIISVSKHFLGYDSWTNNDLQIFVSESPKENILENVRFFQNFRQGHSRHHDVKRAVHAHFGPPRCL